MKNVQLVQLTPEVLVELQQPLLFERERGVFLGEEVELVRDVAWQNEAFRREIDAPLEWAGHLAVDVKGRTVVGSCAFKGAPDDDGVVEIAYYTFPAYEGRGFGTAMAAALVERARLSGAVRRLIAHTLPESNASTRILQRLGFARDGEAQDEDVGTVWRWVRDCG